ncbi:hypothetical protein AB0G76_36800 [Streptomyces asoensis]|uniref:hypothetical protein n=1 Tax=Streptomyces asoensis TaxID=249586 RepID=UPI0033C84415
MSGPTARARDTPGRTPAPRQVDGVLIIDADRGRARYDCFRPGCRHICEGPVYGAAIPEFAVTVKTEHLARHHQGETS